VPDSAYISLARLILKRAKLSLPVNNLVEAMRQRKCFDCGCTVAADESCCGGNEDN